MLLTIQPLGARDSFIKKSKLSIHDGIVQKVPICGVHIVLHVRLLAVVSIVVLHP